MSGRGQMMDRADGREVAEWIRLYTPRLLPVARAFADGADEAEDLLQEVWITAYERARDRRPGTPLGAWLHLVTVNVGRDRARRRARRRRLRTWWRAELPDHTASHPVPGISDELHRCALWRAIAALPRLQREVLLLRVVDDLSVADTAGTLGRAEGTVKVSLHRALARLRASVDLGQPERVSSGKEVGGREDQQ